MRMNGVIRDEEVGLDVLRLGFEHLDLKFQARLKNGIRQRYITSDAAFCLGEGLQTKFRRHT